MLQCRNLEVVLLPNHIILRETEDVEFDYTYQSIEFHIKIKYNEVEFVSIISSSEESCDVHFKLFRQIFILQALGIGYFFTVHDIRFSSFPRAGTSAYKAYAEECRKQIEKSQLYNSSPAWKDEKLFLASPHELLSRNMLDKFIDIYSEDNIRLIHNASLVQCSNSKISDDIRSANIIQLYENLGWYDLDPTRKKSHTLSEWNLRRGLLHIFQKYSLDYFNNNVLGKSFSIQKLTNTRNYMMHFDQWKPKNLFFSTEECVGYSRMLLLYYRYVILKILDFDAGNKANAQIEYWNRFTAMLIKQAESEITDEA